jgi:DNA repair protein RecN (Recombination protein N)
VLTYISVQNFAIIENIEVSFEPGMTALTGETGAGKSLLIDAIGLLLGDRATTNVVRTGSDKAVVEGLFQVTHPDLLDMLDSLDIPYDDGQLMIKRQITASSNNIIKVNNQTITLKELRDITSKLADIHTQMDTHRLIQQDTYLDIIDGFNRRDTDNLMTEYRTLLDHYKQEYKRYDDLQTKSDDRMERLDLMTFQQQELESYHLDSNEEQELTDAVEKMENFDNLFQVLQATKARLDEYDALGTIYDASKQLNAIAGISDTYQSLKDRFESNYYELYDVYETLVQELEGLDFNPKLLDEYQERLNRLAKLQRKYRKTIPELIEYYDQISEEIENIDHYDDLLEAQKKRVKTAYDQVKKKAQEITLLRQKTAVYIETTLLSILADLELPKTEFQIAFLEREDRGAFEPGYLLESGIDDVDFLLTTNVGEPMKPLSKSASGGEMSRIMLGFKNLLATSLNVGLMIFDEIDTGVSGYVAFQVAKKMKEIAQTTQVICITHIPQVAAISEHHLRISKDVEGGRTRAHITPISGPERIQEIAGMISGDSITEASLETAKELLKT